MGDNIKGSSTTHHVRCSKTYQKKFTIKFMTKELLQVALKSRIFLWALGVNKAKNSIGNHPD